MTEQDRFLVTEPSAVEAKESGDKAQKGDGIAQSELQERILEFERLNRLVMAREQRILDLKKEANDLAQAAGKPEPYGSLEQIEKDAALDEAVPAMKDRDAVSGGEPEDLEAADLLNVEDLQTLLAHFCDAVGVASAISDLNGNLLAFANFRRACTQFHRAGEISSQRCAESDAILGSRLEGRSGFHDLYMQEWPDGRCFSADHRREACGQYSYRPVPLTGTRSRLLPSPGSRPRLR